MGSQNFLTANVAGIESMQADDSAHGYDVNRIAAILNGVNPLPITVGKITTLGPIVINGIAGITNGQLQLESGSSSASDTVAQIGLGWAGGGGSFVYPAWISTRHNAGAAAANQMKFWTGDGTQVGTFPTNGVLGLTIDNANVTVPGPASSLQEFTLTNAGNLVRLSGDGGGRLQLGSSAGNTWEVDNNTGTFRIYQPGTSYVTLTTTAFTLNNPLKLVLGTAVSKIVPGATSLSLRNNADGADNLILTDAGLATFRNIVTVTAGTVGLDVTAAGGTTTAAGTATGDKIALYGTQYGIGIQSNRLVLWTDASSFIAIRNNSGAGNHSSGADGILLDPGNSKIQVNANGGMESTGGDLYLSGNSSSTVILRPTRGSGTGQSLFGSSSVDLTLPLKIPPSAGGTVAATSYGSVPVKIGEATSSGSATEFNITSIPGGFRTLKVYGYIVSVSGTSNLIMQFSADQGNNYDYCWLQANNSAASAPAPQIATSGLRVGAMSSAATGPTTFEVVVPGYSSTAAKKGYSATEQRHDGDAAASIITSVYSGLWRSTGAVTSVRISGSTYGNGSWVEVWGYP